VARNIVKETWKEYYKQVRFRDVVQAAYVLDSLRRIRYLGASDDSATANQPLPQEPCVCNSASIMDPDAQQPPDEDLHAEFRACEQKGRVLYQQLCNFDRLLKPKAPGDYQELGDLYNIKTGYLDAPDDTQ